MDGETKHRLHFKMKRAMGNITTESLLDPVSLERYIRVHKEELIVKNIGIYITPDQWEMLVQESLSSALCEKASLTIEIIKSNEDLFLVEQNY